MFQQFIQSVGLRMTRTSIMKVTPSSRLTHTSVAERDTFYTQSQPNNDDHPDSDMSDPFVGEKPKCILCQNRIPVTYKNVQLLSQFISPNTGHIYGQHITKLCRQQQKKISREIKKARHMGFMPVMHRDTIFLKDPDLFGSQYTGNVDIGDAVSLKPRVHSEEPGQKQTGQKKKPVKRFEKKTDGKKAKKK